MSSQRHPADLGVCEAAAALRSGSLTAHDLTTACLDRIETRDPWFSAWLNIYGGDALDAARSADAELAAGRAKPLTGIPIGLKDVIGVAHRPLTADSPVLTGNVAAVDSTVWARLQDAGAILLGHLHCGEFACGTWGLNPWGSGISPDGSSSGSGIAVAARMVPATLGTEARGSIRLPAAAMNVTALKPSFGLVSVAGCIPITFSYDVVGPMARSAADCAVLLEAIAGSDVLDRTTAWAPRQLTLGVEARPGGQPLAHARIGAPRFPDGFLSEQVADVFERAQRELAALGATLVRFDRPENPLEVNDGRGAGWRTVFGAEALAIHQQFADRRHLHGTAFATAFDDLAGDRGSAPEYVRAQMRRGEFAAAWRDVFVRLVLDAVIEPVSASGIPGPPWPDAADTETATGARPPSLVGSWNDANFPVLSIPAGLGPDGVPIGLQLIGLPFSDAQLLQVGVDYQAATDHHAAEPPGLSDRERAPFAAPPRPHAGPQPGYVAVINPIEGMLPGSP